MKRAAQLLVALLLAVVAPLGQAKIITYNLLLNGLQESPVNASPATANSTIILDTASETIRISFTYSNLTTNPTAAHIHCCTAVPGVGTAGVATRTPSFLGFPSSPPTTSGFFDTGILSLIDPTTYNPAFITAQGGLANAEKAFIAGILGGNTYLNIHTVQFGSGEIRAFLPAAAPEPGSIALLGIALAGVAAARRRKPS